MTIPPNPMNENMMKENLNEETVNEIVNRKEKEWENDPVLSKVIPTGPDDIGRILNMSYMARRFFGKSQSWLSQKLNHTVVNGKRADFTKEEKETLRDSLYAIALELESLADDM